MEERSKSVYASLWCGRMPEVRRFSVNVMGIGAATQWSLHLNPIVLRISYYSAFASTTVAAYTAFVHLLCLSPRDQCLPVTCIAAFLAATVRISANDEFCHAVLAWDESHSATLHVAVELQAEWGIRVYSEANLVVAVAGDGRVPVTSRGARMRGN